MCCQNKIEISFYQNTGQISNQFFFFLFIYLHHVEHAFRQNIFRLYYIRLEDSVAIFGCLGVCGWCYMVINAKVNSRKKKGKKRGKKRKNEKFSKKKNWKKITICVCVCGWVLVCMGLYVWVCMGAFVCGYWNGPNPGIVFFQEQKEMQRRKTVTFKFYNCLIGKIVNLSEYIRTWVIYSMWYRPTHRKGSHCKNRPSV